MIVGIGTDIIEVDRIKKNIEAERGFVEKVYTKNEKEYCESKTNKAEHYAVRYAAKEAFFKALGTGWRGGMAFNEIEVINDALGKPDLIIKGETKVYLDKLGKVSIYITLSHVKLMAVAFVVIEKKD
ncbi:MAG TPA: holo-ACP synthase [Cytophagaceae bacterium]|jgi:holo-[acyl-carrier protein] synthase|nr:holo-ACP synthase [Cytophagaceae bacterium]